jgi:DNA-binding response OmpR family regulator
MTAGSGDRSRRSATVLVVDDEPDQLGLLTAYLHREGCTVIAMSTGEQALALPTDIDLDLMVLDLLLPGMNGWRLAAELGRRFPGCPVVITSVLDVQDYPAAEETLPKPVTRSQLAAVLARRIPGWTDR